MKTINIKLVFWILALGLFCCFLFLIPNKPIIAFAEEENSTNDIMTASIDTFVEGTLEWEDDFGNNHPLRGVLVILYDDELNVSKEKLGECITNNSGEYSIGFQNQDELLDGGGCDVFIEIFAGDGDNVKIKQTGGLIQHSFEKGRGEQQYRNVVTGNTVTINHVFNMTSEIGQAMQIGQAVLTARDFASAMKGSLPQNVNVIYPSTLSTSYNHALKNIYIPNDSNDLEYWDWDVIMHEYGHHISYEMGIIDSPGASHWSSQNMWDHFYEHDSNCDCASPSSAQRKEAAIGLTWAESWPTIFGELAQQYFSNRLNGILNTCDMYYKNASTATSWFGYPYETNNVYKGEACEQSIMAILWDLFDTTNEVGDTISLSYQEWWDITTGYGATTFSDFINDFYEVYPEHIDGISENLTKYGMAPKVGGSEYSLEMPRTITWLPQGGSVNFPNNSFIVKIYNRDFTKEVSINSTGTSVTLTDAQWNTILGWRGYSRYVRIIGSQTNSPTTGGYYSALKEYSVFKTAQYGNGSITITGCLVTLEDTLAIPETINGKTIVGIGNWAFQNQTLVTGVTFAGEAYIVTIGTGAFNGCSLLNAFYIPSNLGYLGDWALQGCDPNGLVLVYYGDCGLSTVGTGALSGVKLLPLSNLPDRIININAWAFSGVDFNDDLYLNTGKVRNIGEYAFNNTDITTVILSSLASNIGGYAFNGCNSLTIYTEHASKPSGWANTWNSSNRPVIWNCNFDSTNSYVVSINKTGNSYSNLENGYNSPQRDAYDFGGWYTTSDFSGTAIYDIASAPNGTLYAKWIAQSSCVAEGTMITLADGSEVAVENLTGNEQLLVWNLNTGSFDSAPILFVDNEINAIREIIHLYFSDGTELKIVDEHALWCFDLNEYVYLDKTAENYVGKYFNKKTTTGYTAVELIDVEIYNEITRVYSPVTSEHLCYYVNGLLSIPGGISGLFNIFDVVATELKYDATSMQEDIQTYGLYTYEEFCLEVAEVPENIFEAFNGEYLKVSMGKGLINIEELLALIERYQVFFI